MNDFKGRQAFVTGAASGIGRATALELARRGAMLTIFDRNMVGLEETRDLVVREGAKAACSQLDVTDPEAVSATMREVEEHSGAPDYLVNAAGAFFAGVIESVTDADLLNCFSVNAFGPIYVCRALLPGMARRGSGAIVNISSLHAQNGQPNAALYAAAKGAVMGFTKSLAREKAASGIRANAVAPGPVDTPFWRNAMTGDDAEAAIARRVTSIPLGRLGRPEDVANVIVFLLSSAAAYMTGQVVTVGGGEIMP